MKRGKGRVQDALVPCEEACRHLGESLGMIEREKPSSAVYSVLFDACVKRFEVLFEYAWKLLKVASEFQGREAPGPRPAIQEGLRFGWIEDADFWADALDARNASVHDYFGMTQQDYLKIMGRFAGEVGTLMKKIGQLTEDGPAPTRHR